MSNKKSLTHTKIENGQSFVLDFEKLKNVSSCGTGLVPVAVQDVDSLEILIVAYVNQVALDYAVENKVAAFWSTSRNELWVKGATSGDILDLLEIRVNCEQNSVLYMVRLRGQGACHTKDGRGLSRKSCYYRRLENGSLTFIES